MEKNKNTLQAAIKRLPQYEPEDQLWSAIELGLEAEEHLAKAVTALPEYDAPNSVWDNIVGELEEEPAAKVVLMKKPARRSWIPAMAAAVSLLLVAGWWFRQDGELTETLSYSIEVVETPFISPIDLEDDEEAMTMIENLCESGLIACQEKNFQELLDELREYTDARDELNEVINPNTTDKYLLAQLTDIELERTRIINQLTQKI